MRTISALLAAAVLATAAPVIAADEKKPEDKKAPAAEMKKADKKHATKSASGTVKSAAADSVVVGGKEKGKDTEWTFTVDARTTIKRAGKAAGAADLQAGDSVHVKYAEQDGKAVAQSITARAAGKKAAANPCAPKNPCAPRK